MDLSTNADDGSEPVDVELIRRKQIEGFVQYKMKHNEGVPSTIVGTLSDIEEQSLYSELTSTSAASFAVSPPLPDLHFAPTSLPIAKLKSSIVSTIHNNPIVLIKGQTGCGKSTQVPKFIVEHCMEHEKPINIVVTQPRRLAAQHLAKRVSMELGLEQVGGFVGYKIGLDKEHCSEHSRLVFCTTGILKKMILASKSLNKWTHVILDEVHEREEDMDFIFLLCKTYISTNSSSVRLILMSATIDVDKLLNYFKWKSNLIRFMLTPVLIQVPTEKPFPVQEIYLDSLNDILGLLDTSVGMIEEQHRERPIVLPPLCQLLIKFLINDDAKLPNLRSARDVLIFLPGESDILNVKSFLEEHLPDNWAILPLYARMADRNTDIIFEPIVDKRKVILATNIAESSVTIPNVELVVDFCLTKLVVVDPVTGYESLQLHWADEYNLIQRKGRTGRTMAGRVLRLISRQFYFTRIVAKRTPPPILRASLSKIFLDSKQLDVGFRPIETLSLLIDTPNLKNVISSVVQLKEMGILLPTVAGKYVKDDGDMTYLGTIVSTLPIDVRLGKLVALGYVLGIVDSAVDMAALLSEQSIFALSPRTAIDHAMVQKRAADPDSDCLAALYAYRVWKHWIEDHVLASHRDMIAYCKSHGLRYKILLQTDLKVKEIWFALHRLRLQTLPQPNLRDPLYGIEDVLLIKVSLFAAFYPNYFVRRRPMDMMDEDLIQRQLHFCSSHNSVAMSSFPLDQSDCAAIYHNQIRDLFASISPRKDLRVIVNCSKVVVQFIGGSNRSENIHEKVYQALAIRKAGNLNIKMYNSEVAQRLHHDFESKKKAFMQTLTPSLAPNTLASEMETALLPPDIKTDDFVVRHIEHPNAIWVTLKSDENDHIMKKLRELISSLVIQPQLFCNQGSFHWSVGQLCLARFGKKGFLRARIILLQTRDGVMESTCSLFSVDYGYTVHNISTFHLIPLAKSYSPELLSIPVQAIKMSLYLVQPNSARAYTSGLWDDNAKMAFTSLFPLKGDQDLVLAEVISRSSRGIDVKMYFKNPFTYDSILMDLFCGPSINELFSELVDSSGLPFVQLPAQQRVQREEVPLVLQDGTFLEGFLQSVKEKPTGVATLRGPEHPLEYKLTGVTRVSQNRLIMVSGDSLHSVLLDEYPSCRFDQWFVAAKVDLSQNSTNAVILREVTKMPNTPGLGCLLVTIFAPSVQMFYDSQKKLYVGCLAGLGTSVPGEKNGSVFGKNDMELAFPIFLEEDDLRRINQIRYYLSHCLSQFEHVRAGARVTDELLKSRECILTQLNTLLAKDRSLCQPLHPLQGRYHWKEETHVKGRLDSLHNFKQIRSAQEA